MPQLIKDRAIVDDALDAASATSSRLATVPADVPVIVPLAYWHAAARRAARARRRRRVAGTDRRSGDARGRRRRLAADRGRFSAIHRRPRLFHRAGCCARNIGFSGELRAIGDILRDQLYYLHACGFNAFAVRDGSRSRGRAQGPRRFQRQLSGDRRRSRCRCSGGATHASAATLRLSIRATRDDSSNSERERCSPCCTAIAVRPRAAGARQQLRRRGHGADRPDRAARAADRRLHAGYRPAAGRDLRADRSRARALSTAPSKCSVPIIARSKRSCANTASTPSTAASNCASNAARSARREPLARALAGKRRLDHRPAPRAIARRAPACRSRSSMQSHGICEVQSARRLERRRGLGVHARARRALQPAARPRLPQHRLRALHARHRARRRHPRRRWWWEAAGAQGMRDSSPAAGRRRAHQAAGAQA